MSEALFPLLLWGAVPLLRLHLRDRDGWSAALALAGMAATAGAYFFVGPVAFWPAVGAALFFLAAGAVPLISRRALREVSHAAEEDLTAMRNQLAREEETLASLKRQMTDLTTAMGRLQDRFALVQVLATKLDAGDILVTLGATWRNVPGVRACALLQRLNNGSWNAVYAHGLADTEFWPKFLAEHPTVAQTTQVRHYIQPDRHPAFHKIAASVRPPFLLVPVLWDRDVLALGYVEVEESRLNECTEELSLGRRLVSMGLRRAQLYELMRERSRHDALTGVFLRRVFAERLRESVQKARRYKTPFCLALLDIDFYKQVNDKWGHLVGDKALVHLADAMRRLATPGVVIARYGGDEFALIMEMENLAHAVQWLEALRADLNANPLVAGAQPRPFTLSIGVTECLPEVSTPETLMEEADAALYQAKRDGRDRVATWKRIN